MSTSNIFLRDTLRQSLNDVLSDISLDTDALFPSAPSPPSRQTSLMGAPNAGRNPFSTQMSPSAALGISSEQLMLAAAAEKRIMEEQKMMMELEKARMAAMIRQRALQQALEGRRRTQESRSLLGFFQQSMAGTPVPAQAFMMPNKFTAFKAPVPDQKETLKELGASLREKSSPYVDVADAADPDPNDSRVKKTRGGVTEPFPERLHRLLKEISDDGNGDVISFLPHGRAFAIHKPDKFVSEIMPKYFKQKSLSSFQRQLNLYGFKRMANGRDAGAYYHELFLQGRPNMCLLMRRVGLPKGDDRRKMRSKTTQVDPDFYTMKPVASPPPAVAMATSVLSR